MSYLNIFFAIIAVLLLMPAILTIVIALIVSIKEKSLFGFIVTAWLILCTLVAAYPFIHHLSGDQVKIEWLEKVNEYSVEHYVDNL